MAPFPAGPHVAVVLPETSDRRRNEMNNPNKLSISLPELAFLAASRGALGVGAGLLIANKLSRAQRKSIGLPLFVFGLIATIPIAADLFGTKKGHGQKS